MTPACEICAHPVSDDTLSVPAWEAHGLLVHGFCPTIGVPAPQLVGLRDGGVTIASTLYASSALPAPHRVWLRRTRGWRMPPNTVKVTRGNGMKWGNPYRVGDHRFTRQDPCRPFAEPTPENCVKWFRAYALETPGYIDRVRAELRGKNLACFCKPGAPCHAEVLLELANG